MQEKSWEIKEIPTWVSQKEASALSRTIDDMCRDAWNFESNKR